MINKILLNMNLLVLKWNQDLKHLKMKLFKDNQILFILKIIKYEIN